MGPRRSESANARVKMRTLQPRRRPWGSTPRLVNRKDKTPSEGKTFAVTRENAERRLSRRLDRRRSVRELSSSGSALPNPDNSVIAPLSSEPLRRNPRPAGRRRLLPRRAPAASSRRVGGASTRSPRRRQGRPSTRPPSSGTRRREPKALAASQPCGGRYGIRTRDCQIISLVLYPLS